MNCGFKSMFNIHIKEEKKKKRVVTVSKGDIIYIFTNLLFYFTK